MITACKRRWWYALLAGVTTLYGSLDARAASRSTETESYDVHIGVFFDAQGTVCSGTIRPGVPGTIYILSKSRPGTEVPSGAEFSFEGLPSTWSAYAVPNPGALSLGDPFANGVNIATLGRSCAEPDANPILLLYTVLILATDEQDDVRFRLVARLPPSNPGFDCPLITECEAPTFYMRCARSVPCFVNATAPAPCAAAITAVQSTTWTGLRALYR